MRIPALERRRAERAEMISRAGGFAAALCQRVDDLCVAVVIGSVARGDWNRGSDIDLVVIARDLPADPRARAELSVDSAFPGVEAMLWTPEELGSRRTRRDPAALEAQAIGIVVAGGWERLGDSPAGGERPTGGQQGGA